MPFLLDRTSDHETECWNARIDSRQGLAEFLDGDQSTDRRRDRLSTYKLDRGSDFPMSGFTDVGRPGRATGVIEAARYLYPGPSVRSAEFFRTEAIFNTANLAYYHFLAQTSTPLLVCLMQIKTCRDLLCNDASIESAASSTPWCDPQTEGGNLAPSSRFCSDSVRLCN